MPTNGIVGPRSNILSPNTPISRTDFPFQQDPVMSYGVSKATLTRARGEPWVSFRWALGGPGCVLPEQKYLPCRAGNIECLLRPLAWF
jgi:hypothetical protein